MKTILKGLLMTVIAFLVTTYQTSGLPADTVAWQVLGITVAGTVMVYIGQSVLLPSTSILGMIDTRDFLKASILGVGNLLATYTAAMVTGTSINWMALLASASSLILAYFFKQLKTPPAPPVPVVQ